MVKSKVDPCMFCGEAPCVCNKPIKAEPKKRAARPKPEEPIAQELGGTSPTPEVGDGVVAKKLDFKAAMKARAAATPPPPPPPAKPKAVDRRQSLNEDDVLFAAAVRALGPLLREDEREKYRVILTSTETPQERMMIWKARRREFPQDA